MQLTIVLAKFGTKAEAEAFIERLNARDRDLTLVANEGQVELLIGVDATVDLADVFANVAVVLAADLLKAGDELRDRVKVSGQMSKPLPSRIYDAQAIGGWTKAVAKLTGTPQVEGPPVPVGGKAELDDGFLLARLAHADDTITAKDGKLVFGKDGWTVDISHHQMRRK